MTLLPRRKTRPCALPSSPFPTRAAGVSGRTRAALIVEMLTAAGYQVEETMILPDEAKALKAQLIRLADGRQVNLILTTGGTGFAPGISPRSHLCRGGPQRPRYC